MGIFIKNPETEKAVRKIAALRGQTITGVIDALARDALEREAPAPPPRTLESMRAATDAFRRKAGLDKVKLNLADCFAYALAKQLDAPCSTQVMTFR
jgi:antitoxin VapB